MHYLTVFCREVEGTGEEMGEIGGHQDMHRQIVITRTADAGGTTQDEYTGKPDYCETYDCPEH